MKRRPVVVDFWNGRVWLIVSSITKSLETYVDLGGVINVRVDATLENVLEVLRLSVLTLEQTGQVDVKESGTGKSERLFFSVRTCDRGRTGTCGGDQLASGEAWSRESCPG